MSWLQRMLSRTRPATDKSLPDGLERMLVQRVVVLHAPIGDEIANLIIAQLLYLDDQSSTRPIRLVLNSPGGHVSSALAIRDTIDYVRCPVHTCVTGQVAGVAVSVLVRGTRGERVAHPRARIQLVPISAGIATTNPADVARTEATIVDMLVADSGQAADTIRADMQRSRTFSAESARSYGLIDRIGLTDR